MILLWKPGFGSLYKGSPFPAKKMLGALGLDPHLYSLCLFREGELVAYSDSLVGKFAKEGFAWTLSPLLGSISKEAGQFFQTVSVTQGSGDKIFPVDHPETTHHATFFRILWRPLNARVTLLVLSLLKSEATHPVRESEFSEFLVETESYFEEHDEDLLSDHYIRNLSWVSEKDIHNDMEYVRILTGGHHKMAMERLCNSDGRRFDRVLVDGPPPPVERCCILSSKRTLENEIGVNPHVIRTVRVRIGFFAGGLYPFAFLNISGVGFERCGKTALLSAVRKIGHGDLETIPFLSLKYGIFNDSWAHPPGGFLLSKSDTVFSHLDEVCRRSMILTIPGMMSVLQTLFRRLRTNDILFYDEVSGEGHLLLRGCFDPKMAEKTVKRDLREMGVPVSDCRTLDAVLEDMASLA